MAGTPSRWRDQFGEAKQVGLRLPVKVIEMARDEATRRGVPFSDVVVEALLSYCSDWRPTDDPA